MFIVVDIRIWNAACLFHRAVEHSAGWRMGVVGQVHVAVSESLFQPFIAEGVAEGGVNVIGREQTVLVQLFEGVLNVDAIIAPGCGVDFNHSTQIAEVMGRYACIGRFC